MSHASRRAESDGQMEINAILAAEAAAAAAAESDIYMTYDRNAKRIDNRRQSHNDVKQRSRSSVRSSPSHNTPSGAVVWTTPSKPSQRYRPPDQAIMSARAGFHCRVDSAIQPDGFRFRSHFSLLGFRYETVHVNRG